MSAHAATVATSGQVSSIPLTLDVTGSVATITVGSGLRHNVLEPHDWDELASIADAVAARSDIKVAVIRGGGQTFSAGSNLRSWDGADARTVDDGFLRIEAALQAIERIPVPTLAVVEGVAAGAGCELALACDLRLFTRSARIGLPIVQLGVLVSPHFALRLTVLVGVARSRELLYSGRLVLAAEAERLGLANSVVPQDDLDAEVVRWVEDISRQPRSGLVAAKTASSRALRELRRQHDAPGWRFSDPSVFRGSIRAFFARRTR
jgi:enoyl-CoA hydratase